jgi:hypothetical protein
MPSIYPPELDASQLLFDEGETRAILRFIRPIRTYESNTFTPVDDEVRKLAQALLMVAIESSYAMGYIDILFAVVSGGGRRSGFPGLQTMGRKLATRYAAHWWKHTRREDLTNIRIYEAVRRTIERNFASIIDLLVAERSAAKAAAALAQLRRVPLHVPVSQACDRSYWS